MLTVLDEYSRECLAIVVARRLRADDVLQTLSELFVEHGPPANLRSDNGPEFTAKVVREWLERVEVKTLYIEPGSPWENGYNENFNGTLGEEVLKREIFYSLEEAKVLTEQWRREYNTIRPHSSLRYRPPAPEALRPDPFFLNLPKLNGPHPRLQEAVGLTQQVVPLWGAGHYRWRKEFGGMKVDQARHVKELEQENARLKRAVANLTLDKLILEEAAKGNF